jgi:HEPN domain-containing protein
MNPATLEWVEKAEWDFRSAHRELRVRRQPNCDLLCFLCQQCAEKYLKARLVEAGRTFAKIHDLEELLDAVLRLEPHLEHLRPGLASLTDHAVVFRYPGESATKEVAQAAFLNCSVTRAALRQCLGLDEPPTGQMKLVIKERQARYRVRRRRK